MGLRAAAVTAALDSSSGMSADWSAADMPQHERRRTCGVFRKMQVSLNPLTGGPPLATGTGRLLRRPSSTMVRISSSMTALQTIDAFGFAGCE